jgi:lantibiotic transport system ATP-binding protein
MNNIIITEDLCYEFAKGTAVLKNVNLIVPEGAVYGFLGPNGAGKTTTLRLLLGLLRMQKGSVKIYGNSFAQNRISILKQTGSLIEQPSLYPHLTGSENLDIYRIIYSCTKQRVDEVLKLVKLDDARGKLVKAYSLGMKQRLSIALALLHKPKLLILDEPTNGLDPQGIIEIRELIASLAKDTGVTVLVSSHNLSEVEKIATHVGIINKGSLLFQGNIEELQKMKSKNKKVMICTSDNDAALSIAKKHFADAEIKGEEILINADDKGKIALLNREIVHGGIGVYEISTMKNNLEDLFIELTTKDNADINN